MPLFSCRAGITASTLLIFLCGTVAGSQTPVGLQSATPPALSRPALVVLITVDQFRGDYIDRFRPQLTGGLDRLMRKGAVFTDAHHDHAITETAPGHATLLSGRFPRSTGIMLNRIGVEDPVMPLVENGIGTGASPARFVGTTLVDWIRNRDRGARVLSVSMKDRGAILPVGRTKADVFWYSSDSRFVTSTYYAPTLPGWVKAFNDRRMPQSYAGKVWNPLLPDSAYKERDSSSVESAGRESAFPHPLPSDSMNAGSLVRTTPWMDDITLAFALHGLTARELGNDGGAQPRTDLLAISLSATDVIGHRFGPDSREMHDQVVRVDRAIGRFLDSLFVLRDSSRVLIALTADHGVGTIPELAAAAVPPPVALPDRVELYSLLPEARVRLREAKVDSNAIDVDEQIVLLDRSAFKKSKLNPDSLLAWFAATARRVPGVLRVDRFPQLLADTATDEIARRWGHQFPPDLRIDLVATLLPGSTWGGNVASHGSPHAYDSHVPLIFMGPGVKAGVHKGFVRTVDLAPTLADLIGVKPGERLDGVVLPVR